MTDLLSRPSGATRRSRAAVGSRRTSGEPAGGAGTRSPAARATAAGLLAPLTGLGLVWVLALAGWYSSDGGGHGTTRDALRVGTDAWLLAHGSHLAIRDGSVAAVPLGLTLLFGWLAYRGGRWAGATSAVEDLRGAGLATVILSGVYAVTAMVAGVLAAAPGAEPSPLRAFTGALLLAAVAGGWGLVSGAGLVERVPQWFPLTARSAAYGGVVTALGTVAAALLLVLGSLAVHGAGAARILTEVGGGPSGAAFALLVAVLLLPNAGLLGAAYLLGPGFALGTGTIVSTSVVSLGPVPASPLLAALPSNGSPPGWLTAVLGVPVVLAAVGCWMAGRRLPTASYRSAAIRGLAAAAAAALLLTVAIALAGGAVGGGRMSQIGAPTLAVLLRSLPAFGSGGVLGALACAWWTRRHDVAEAETPHRPEVLPALASVRGSVHDAVQEAGRAWTQRTTPADDLSAEDTVRLQLSPDEHR